MVVFLLWHDSSVWLEFWVVSVDALFWGSRSGLTNETKVIKKRMWDVVACVDFLPKEISLLLIWLGPKMPKML